MVKLVHSLLQRDHAVIREKTAVAGHSCRQHAVKEVYAVLNTLEDIVRRTDSHHIARLFFWDVLGRPAEKVLKLGLALTYRKASDRNAREVHLADRDGAFLSQILVEIALDNAKEVSPEVLGKPVPLCDGALCPELCHSPGLFCIPVFDVRRSADIKAHCDVAAYHSLDVNNLLWREDMTRAVNMPSVPED